jgi:hypothetical protein
MELPRQDNRESSPRTNPSFWAGEGDVTGPAKLLLNRDSNQRDAGERPAHVSLFKGDTDLGACCK